MFGFIFVGFGSKGFLFGFLFCLFVIIFFICLCSCFIFLRFFVLMCIRWELNIFLLNDKVVWKLDNVDILIKVVLVYWFFMLYLIWIFFLFFVILYFLKNFIIFIFFLLILSFFIWIMYWDVLRVIFIFRCFEFFCFGVCWSLLVGL